MPVFKDQTGRTISLKSIPKRIISLVPSQTELLADLELTTEVIGITKFCIHPQSWFRNKTRVGGTKNIKLDIIDKLQPDLIIANKEENVKEQIEELEKKYSVWVSDINDLSDAYEMIKKIGDLVERKQKAEAITESIKSGFSRLSDFKQISTCYLIWKDPFMTIGSDTFIHSILSIAGLNNIYQNKKRYPQITIEEIKQRNPELLLLSSEPFPFTQKHIDELQIHLPNTKILLVDGEMFSWYGSRLLKTPNYIKSLRQQIN